MKRDVFSFRKNRANRTPTQTGRASRSPAGGGIRKEIDDSLDQFRRASRRRYSTDIPLPVLKGAGKLKEIREGLKLHERELTVVDLIDATSNTASYEEYAVELKKSAKEALNYYGIAIYGNRKLVNKYTGSLGLLR